MKDTLTRIRAKCMEVNPAIETDWSCSGGKVIYSHKGREVRLSDVLLAATKDWYREPGRLNTWVFFGTQQNDLLCLVALWNPRQDDLEKQSPETVEFIGKLLGV